MSQKILLAFSDTENINTLRKQILAEQHTIETCSFNLHSIQQAILLLTPDIVVIYCKTAHPSLIQTIRIIQDKTPKPLIIFTDYSSDNMIADGIIAGASAFVVNGIKANAQEQTQNISSIIAISLSRFKKYSTTQQNTDKTPRQLLERQNIDRAKGFLMKTKGISEDKAYQFLRNMAMNSNQRISQISQLLLKTPKMHQ